VSLLGRLRALGAPPAPQPDLQPIFARLDALEAMVEGLQDSVDRQVRRQDERLDEMARRIAPDELARSLSADARKRGL
jgi:hypothetical protein